jgi:hypothetical protein
MNLSIVKETKYSSPMEALSIGLNLLEIILEINLYITLQQAISL